MKKFTTVLLAGALTLLTACGGEKETAKNEGGKKFEGDTLVVSTWGYNEDKLRSQIFDPFEEEFGVTVELATGGTSDRYTKLASNPNTDIDLFYTAQHIAQKGVEAGLFEEFDRTKVANIESLYDMAKAPNGDKYGMAYTVNRLRVAINPNNLPEGVEVEDIKSWKDLWKPELAGQITIPGLTTTYGPAMLYIASINAGVDIESDGGAAAIEELEKLMVNVKKSYSRSSNATSMLKEGEVSIALLADYAYTGVVKAAPEAIFIDPSEGAFINFNTINLIKGTPNKELAYEFINYALSKEVQDRTSHSKLEAPVNKNVVLSEEDQEANTYLAALTNANSVNAEYVNTHIGNWIDKWNEIVTK